MPEIEHLLRIAAAPKDVGEIVRSEGGLLRWWTVAVTTTGGHGTGTPPATGSERPEITIEEKVPERIIEWSFESGPGLAGTQVLFYLEREGDETLLRMTHAGWPRRDDRFLAINTLWGDLLYRLKDRLEGPHVGRDGTPEAGTEALPTGSG